VFRVVPSSAYPQIRRVLPIVERERLRLGIVGLRLRSLLERLNEIHALVLEMLAEHER